MGQEGLPGFLGAIIAGAMVEYLEQFALREIE